jgi:outer membrane immunogenic protein
VRYEKRINRDCRYRGVHGIASSRRRPAAQGTAATGASRQLDRVLCECGRWLWVMVTRSHDSTTFGGVPGVTISQTDGGNGWLGRFGGGCDYQLSNLNVFGGRIVIGAFGDYDVMDLRGTNSPLEVNGAGFPISSTEKETGAWSGGARIGYLITPSVLTYFDGGYTGTRFASQSLTSNLGVPTGFGYPAHNYSGWFLGGGTETALADFVSALPASLFLRTEYRFSDYGRTNLAEIALATGLPDGNVEHTRPYVQTVTTSLVWRFNWLAPIMAKY